MTHSVHPYSFRLGIIRDWKSHWFRTKQYQEFLQASIVIREWMDKRLRGMYVEGVEITCSPNIFSVVVKTSRPGIIIGRGGEGVDKLKKEIIKQLSRIKQNNFKEVKVAVEEVRSPESKAKIISQMIAENLEKRLPFRRVMKQAIDRAKNAKDVKGVKVLLKGRLGGAEMGRTEWLRDGQIPLQTLRADIDFAREKAHLPYGDVGIKVWIYKGEIFSGESQEK